MTLQPQKAVNALIHAITTIDAENGHIEYELTFDKRYRRVLDLEDCQTQAEKKLAKEFELLNSTLEVNKKVIETLLELAEILNVEE